ncbi:MAG: serine hydrolase, partial [Bacteroidetes bacterium]|nr:serine hydrolase [Bacteroidota bacterium]
MRTRTVVKRLVLVVVLALLTYGIRYAWVSFPIISGYGAKNLCSCMFVAGRSEKSVLDDELSDSPLTLGSFSVDMKDSSVTGSVIGFAKRKAVYRKGLGCTLLNDVSEEQLRRQSFVLAKPPVINADSIDWPMGDRLPADSLPSNINKNLLMNAVDSAFAERDPKKKVGTRAVLVIYDGRLVAERYAPGYDLHSKMLGWSMSKSITGTLVGILAREGKLNIDAPAPVPEWKDPSDPRHDITLKNLLQQASGLDYLEDYSKASTATNMLFKKG